MKQIKKIEATTTALDTVRVAAYARVSKDSERLSNSFENQVEHYEQLIRNTPGWEYAGVFADFAITGTTTTRREGFNNLINLARAGGVDVILTKSVSRFARNTVDLLETIRELKALGVEVQFERENISTLSMEGELLVTLLASFAQAESEQISQNAKWGIKQAALSGRAHSRQPYGYRFERGQLTVVEEEAEVIRLLFANYLAGISPEATAQQLNVQGLRSRNGGKFTGKTLRPMLESEVYAGDVLVQKLYRPVIGNTKTVPNTGMLDQILLEEHHEPIIDRETYGRVQAELARRRASGGRALTPTGGTNALTHHIICGVCGRKYHRRTKRRASGSVRKFWWCQTATKGLGNPCRARQLDEGQLKAMVLDACGMESWSDEQILALLDRIEINSQVAKVSLTNCTHLHYSTHTWTREDAR